MTPTPTGKIKGSLRDVMPKLQNFSGAVKVTTTSGKGGILVEMGKPVAAYLTQEGVLHRGKPSLSLLEKEQMAEFELIRYDDEQFKEAMAICDNRGLLLEGESVADTGTTPPAGEAKPREEKNVLSSMMKRFVSSRARVGEEAAPAAGSGAEKPVIQEAKEGRDLSLVPPAERGREESKIPEPLPAPPGEMVRPAQAPEKKEVAADRQETELSAIIKRLRETGKEGKATAPPEAIPEKVAATIAGEKEPGVKAPAAESLPPPEPIRAAGAEERPKPEAPAVKGGVTAPADDQAKEGRVRVDLGKMMKRIKRLDISSIREELKAGAREGEAGIEGAPGASMPAPAAPSEAALPAPDKAPEAQAVTGAKSDIDELKAFIQRLEVLEERTGGSPKGTGAPFGRAEEKPPSPEAQAPRIPVPEKGLGEAAPPEIREATRPSEPDRKAKISSILKRSGLVKPSPDEQPVEPVPEIRAESLAGEQKEAVVTPPEGEVEIRVPRPQRKKVEITRVPKRPEKPLKEPPLLDEKMIQKILKQPGVIAVSTFFEGFAVQSAGKADFEQVAANAEDLFRAGKKIAREIDIGPLSQIILETGKGKLVIAPHGDLNVCIFNEADANLGLIRVAIKSMQTGIDG